MRRARRRLRIMRSHAGVPQGWCLAMCLILLAWRVHPNFPCVVAANRDEYFARPTASADWWPGDSGILAGRDLQAGGTRPGVTPRGRFAALTNFRDPAAAPVDRPPRGAPGPRFSTGR